MKLRIGYRVKLTVQHPAYDELDGFVYHVTAFSKSEAAKKARQEHRDAGYMNQGRITCFATPHSS